MHQARSNQQDNTVSENSSYDDEDGEAEMEEIQNAEPPFSKLLKDINSQLSILNEDQVTWISFDWNATDCYLKCSYNKATPIE